METCFYKVNKISIFKDAYFISWYFRYTNHDEYVTISKYKLLELMSVCDTVLQSKDWRTSDMLLNNRGIYDKDYYDKVLALRNFISDIAGTMSYTDEILMKSLW